MQQKLGRIANESGNPFTVLLEEPERDFLPPGLSQKAQTVAIRAGYNLIQVFCALLFLFYDLIIT